MQLLTEAHGDPRAFGFQLESLQQHSYSLGIWGQPALGLSLSSAFPVLDNFGNVTYHLGDLFFSSLKGI